MRTDRNDARSLSCASAVDAARSRAIAYPLSTQNGGTEMIAVRDEHDLRKLVEDLLRADRIDPVVGMTDRGSGGAPLLPYAQVRGIVGDDARIYLISSQPLRDLRNAIGSPFALSRPAARVWWPGLSNASDPADHPSTIAVDGESEQTLLEEFCRGFDLTRPRVRREIKLIEDIRALAEHQLDEANRRVPLTQRSAFGGRTGRRKRGEGSGISAITRHGDVA
jgi:hypothetical protein